MCSLLNDSARNSTADALAIFFFYALKLLNVNKEHINKRRRSTKAMALAIYALKLLNVTVGKYCCV